MKKNIAIILSGCGVFDGSEIYESTLTFLAIEHNGSAFECFAPDINQARVMNHLTGEISEGEVRNVLVESARLCRGEIKNLNQLNPEEFDALIFPGGFGAASNLCDFAELGAKSEIIEEICRVTRAFANASKPVGFICIAPALVPLIYKPGVKVTIGNDVDTAATIEEMGASHVECGVEDICVDTANKVVTTPAFMLAHSISEAQAGIEKLVAELTAMCD